MPQFCASRAARSPHAPTGLGVHADRPCAPSPTPRLSMRSATLPGGSITRPASAHPGRALRAGEDACTCGPYQHAGCLLWCGGSGDESAGPQWYSTFEGYTDDYPIRGWYPGRDLPNRAFHAAESNRVWVTDFAYVRTWAGWAYAVFIIDVFSRKIVAWHADEQGRHRGDHSAANGIVAT